MNRTEERFCSMLETALSPASYNLQRGYRFKACCVPFNCSAHAQALADITNVPAPCTYNITFRKHRIQGGASLRFTSSLGSENKNTFEEDFEYQWPAKSTIPGKIFRGKLPRYNEEGPSVSEPAERIGVFSLSEDESTSSFNKPIKLIEPLYHNFPYEVNTATLRYQGIHWSLMRSQRPHLSGSPDVPGVGSYNLLDKPPNPFDVYYQKVKFCNKVKSRSLRTLDTQNLRLKYLNEPGPADYDIVTKFDKMKSIHDTGIFSKAKRETLQIKDTPQSDLDISTFFKHRSKQKCWPPFNSSSRRTKIIKSAGRSPAEFNIWNHTLVYSVAKELSFPRVVHPFNSSAKRICKFTAIQDNPDPSAYCIQRFPFIPRKRVFGAKDALSCVPAVRLVPIRHSEQNEIAPCTYKMDSSFKKLCKRRDFHKGEIWKLTRRDRLKWLIKDGPDVLYAYGDMDLCMMRCGRPAGTIYTAAKGRATCRPTPIEDYFTNRRYRRVKALVSVDATRGEMSPSPRSATSGDERKWNI